MSLAPIARNETAPKVAIGFHSTKAIQDKKSIKTELETLASEWDCEFDIQGNQCAAFETSSECALRPRWNVSRSWGNTENTCRRMFCSTIHQTYVEWTFEKESLYIGQQAANGTCLPSLQY